MRVRRGDRVRTTAVEIWVFFGRAWDASVARLRARRGLQAGETANLAALQEASIVGVVGEGED